MNLLRDNIFDSVTTRNQDLKQRRIVNAGDAIDPQDYITKKQLDASIVQVSNKQVVQSSGGVWIPLGAFAAGWTAANTALYGVPAVKLQGDSLLFRGQITGGTITDATVIYTTMPLLPPFLTNSNVSTANAGFTVISVGSLYLFANGNLKVYGMVAGTVNINLNCVMVFR
jgi:hypothetical protein